ncbi:universal stress protein [Frigoribacterium sp. VKM Ac-2530]|uniref:universal stress protein n=1 Tax=Frigoribacterium sp. VKM Ac-2530 TaxID=2783822 RepID=UPI00188BEBEA|nr:universal stress protein [Frigoribacterium sp. VKM Ac-2530]MBF4578428.1 universal stress protein [Frigoribacterium sp. VKM Ac-2530]
MDQTTSTRTASVPAPVSTSPSRHVETYPLGDPRLLGIEPGSIVVGHDGSPGADAALEVALGLADDLGVPIAVIRTWSIFDAPNPAGFTFGYASSFPELATAVQKALGEDTAAATARHPDLRPQLREVRDVPEEALPRLSAGARMLVMGSRGLGSVRSALLGSVSASCVHRATCPVLIVPLHRS